MAELSANSDFVIATAGAIATLGILAYVNRREISRIKDSLWGNDRSEGGGLEGDVGELEEEVEEVGNHIEEKLDSIAGKIDEEREERRIDHQRVTSEMRKTRVLVHVSVEGLVSTLNDELDADVDPGDIRPDWFDDEELLEPDGGTTLAYDDGERAD